MQIFFRKFVTTLSTLLSMLVYNFHKPIKGIKTKKNIKYCKNGNKYNKLDISYKKDEKNNLKPCVIYFHGGGWCSYSKSIYSTLTRRIASMGYIVFNVNYSLAPKYKIDRILNDAAESVNFVIENAKKYGGDNTRIFLGGDSAGAHITAMTMVNILKDKIKTQAIIEKIKGLFLFYGVYDIKTALNSGFPNIKAYAKAAFYNREKDCFEHYNYSPINFISNEFPSCFIASGEIDKLHKTQSETFNDKLKENKVKTDVLFFNKNEKRAMHAFMIFDGLETNKITLERLENFLQGESK